MQAHAPAIAMVAGEASGDLLAALLLDGLRTRWSGLRSMGIGGAQMRERGFEAWWDSDTLAVRGYVEVLRHYRRIVGMRQQLRQRLLGQPPDLFIGVDAPDFNLDLALSLKTQGIKTAHFICPSVWAWRAHRLEKIRRAVDHVLCIFPFEPALLAAHGIAATYVGHPLASVIPLHSDPHAARAQLGLLGSQPVLAVLPGSRVSEVRALGPRFMQACRLLLQQQPKLQLVLPTLPALRPLLDAQAQASGLGERLLIVNGQSHTVLAACDAALVASGTATLEAALFKRPMVIAYHMNPLSWQLMKRQKLQDWVGLPNILCGDFVVPELLQDAATPAALAAALWPWLRATPAPALPALQDRFTALHLSLRRDTPGLATDAIHSLLKP